MDLSTKFLHLKLKNPTILASGVLGTSGVYFSTLEKCGVGAVTMKSFSLQPREGHKNPVILVNEDYMLNAVGLTNPGIDESIAMLKEAKKHCKIPVIGSIFGKNIEDFGEAAKLLSEAKPDLVEVNISCPNIEYDQPISCSPELTAKVTELVKANTKIPISIKLSPNTENLTKIAKSAEVAGADAITSINTGGPGMRINLETKTPMLSNKFGGLSGPALLPIALRCVYQIYEAVDIPIIGTGGVMCGKDAIEMLMAGASAVGVGSGVYYRGNTIFQDICDEMSEWMKKNGYTTVSQLTGAAHEQ